MKNIILIGILAIIIPLSAIAQEVPLYIETDGELSFSSDILSDFQVTEMLGGAQVSQTFGRPVFVLQNGRTGKTSVSYILPEEYEVISNGDGNIENQHNDLIFTENEGTDTRDDLEFDESEGTIVADDLEFSADEAIETGSSMTFSQGEALVGFDGPSDFFNESTPNFIQPQHGIWNVQLDSAKINGCPPGVGDLAISQLPTSKTIDVYFNEPGWVPANLNSDYARYSWVAVGKNGFFAEPFSTGAEAAGSGMSLSVTTGLAAQSGTKINVWARVLLNLTPMLAAMAGGSETCTAVITGTYTKD